MSENRDHSTPDVIGDSPETPEADAAEQRRTLREGDAEEAGAGEQDEGRTGQAAALPERPLEADPADAAEQRRVVDLDEEDYR